MKKLARYAIPLAIVCGAIMFGASFWLLRGANWSLGAAVGAAAGLFLLTSAGVWLMTDSRGTRELQADMYTAEAELLVRKVLRQVTTLRQHAAKIHNTQTVHLVEQVCADVQVLIGKIRERNPNALQSSATILLGHLDNLELVLDQYVEIQEQPRYFEDPAKKLQGGEAAISGLSEFLVKSIRLVERGDTVGYDVALKMLEATKYSALA